MKKPQIAFTTIVALTGLFLFLVTRPSNASPTITWTPQHLSQEVIAGRSTSTTISFSSDEKLTDAWVKVSDELGRTVAITPVSLGTVSPKQVVSLTVVAHPTATTSPGTIQGTISLYRKTPSRDIPYGSALSANVAVSWPSVTTPLVTVSYPPALAAQGGQIGEASVTTGSGGVTYVDIPLSTAGNPPVTVFRIAIYANSSSQSLEVWFEQNIDTNGILLQSGSYASQVFADGKIAFIDSAAFPPSYDGPLVTGYAYIISPQEKYIASITLSQDKSYLYLLGYRTPEAMVALLQNITATLTFNE
jgi:hypothetical protein